VCACVLRCSRGSFIVSGDRRRELKATPSISVTSVGVEASSTPSRRRRRPLDTHVGKSSNFYVICYIPSVASVARGGTACPRRRFGRSHHADVPYRPGRVRRRRHRSCCACRVRAGREVFERREVQGSHGAQGTAGQRQRSGEARHEAGEASLGGAPGWTVFQMPSGWTVFQMPPGCTRNPSDPISAAQIR
jgi:hypothetical protein